MDRQKETKKLIDYTFANYRFVGNCKWMNISGMYIAFVDGRKEGRFSTGI